MPYSALQFIDEHQGHQGNQSQNRAQHADQNIGPDFQETGKDGANKIVIDDKRQSDQRDDYERRKTAVIQDEAGYVGRKKNSAQHRNG